MDWLLGWLLAIGYWQQYSRMDLLGNGKPLHADVGAQAEPEERALRRKPAPWHYNMLSQHVITLISMHLCYLCITSHMSSC